MTKKSLARQQRAIGAIDASRHLHDLRAGIALTHQEIEEAELAIRRARAELERQVDDYNAAANRAIDRYFRLRQTVGSRFKWLPADIRARIQAFEQRVARRPTSPDQRCFEITDSLEQLRKFSMLISALVTALAGNG